MRVTLAQVASKASVSKATASMALRGDSRISSKTREKVRAASIQLGYRPDPALALIASHRWKTHRHGSKSMLAWITCEDLLPNTGKTRSSVFSRLSLLQRRAETLGHTLNIFHLREHRSPAALSRLLLHRGVRGVLFSAIPNSQTLTGFNYDDFSLIAFELGLWHPPWHCVRRDVFADARHTWQKVQQSGYLRIGVVAGEIKSNQLHASALAPLLFEQILLPRRTPRIPPLLGDIRHGTFERWRRKHQPDAIIFSKTGFINRR
ncbi:MAG: LacI family transcriptional regulator [Blastochloris sp.]|nr:LacI family transcriptional regulator [Blastochloris sp.]